MSALLNKIKTCVSLKKGEIVIYQGFGGEEQSCQSINWNVIYVTFVISLGQLLNVVI